MNIGKMTFKHGHIVMMECYILRVKAVDVEYIGKYKDERAYSIDILYTLDSASLLVKLKPRIFQRLPPFE
jgi:hypothetical protein